MTKKVENMLKEGGEGRDFQLSPSHPSAILPILNPTLKITIFVLNSSVGLVMRGKILLNAGFVSLDLNFNVEKEPKLNLNTDVDFAVENVLCMQLSQPDDVFK